MNVNISGHTDHDLSYSFYVDLTLDSLLKQLMLDYL